MIRITPLIIANIEKFKKNLELYQNGELVDFKSFSSFMGVYKQRTNETYMIRPRTPGGVINLEQLEAVSDIAKKYGKNKIRFTTRQDIQFHWVNIKDLNRVLDELLKHGLTTMSAGGDSVRNIACSPLSGVAQDEIFDVTPYVEKVASFMTEDPKNLSLPRKFKISFSSSQEDTANATIADIGFIAKIVNGKRGFEVYGGGGLGNGARIALKIKDFIEDSEALYYVQAMKRVFEKEGDRTNRSKARLRFVVQKLGEEKFLKVFQKELALVKKTQTLRIRVDLNPLDTSLANPTQMVYSVTEKYRNIVFPQKQEGCYSLYIHPQNGNITAENLDEVINFLKKLDYKINLRLTLSQGFMVRDLKYEDVQKLIAIISEFINPSKISQSITCAGPTICNYGINNSQGLLNQIIQSFKDESSDLQNVLPKIMISGCHNSCGQHQKGQIGLTGKKRRVENIIIPMYTISFNGRVGAHQTRFGDVYGEIPAKKIPNFLLELANLKLDSGYSDFVEFVNHKNEDIQKLVYQYSSIESFAENPLLYSDFE